MPLLNGIDATRHLKKVSPDVKVIFVTMHADPAYLNEAFKAGASGYLLKRSAGTELIQAIQSVLRGNFYVTPLLTKGLVNTVIGEAAVPLLDKVFLRQDNAKFCSSWPKERPSKKLPNC